jgi:hypothetical protein
MAEKYYYSMLETNLRAIAKKRGCQIMIALRRYKNENDHWPRSLEDIKSFVPGEILIDSMNGGNFVYELTDENFRLYSKGFNNIDENGRYESHWPQDAQPDDRLIWPLWQAKRNEKEDTDVEAEKSKG